MSHLSTRSHRCNEPSADQAGQSVVLHGWAHQIRNKSQVIFIVLRDRSGQIQITIDESCPKEIFETASKVRFEYTLEVKGTVRLRAPEAVNPQMETGDVEILVEELTILSGTKPLPFNISDKGPSISEEIRLKYRYLDLRQSNLQRNLKIRHQAALATRNYLDSIGFYEIETPILNRSTPEGARDYLVPSRVHPGMWYALPQSPQIFKQILMIGGMDRYFQICKCFRDEDLRADRQPEFTQIDIEMSFVTQDQIIDMANGLVREIWKRCINVDVGEIPVLTYAQVIERFGVDNPDLRFGMELFTLNAQQSEFVVLQRAFDAGGIARGIVVKDGADSSRKTIDKNYTEFVKKYRLGGLLWGKVTQADEGLTWKGPLSKVEPELLSTIPNVEAGDLVLLGAGPANHVNTAIGRLRRHIALERNLPEKEYAFCWVTEFPAFDYDEETDIWHAVHHPFTKPIDDHLEWLGTDKMGDILSDAYDIVCNGYEIGGGSIRIHDSTVQKQIFDALGLSEEEAKEKFGFLIEALQYGAPPHGGLAMGFDRWIMLLAKTDNIRDVIAFPKTTKAQDLMAEAPNRVAQDQLLELSVQNIDNRPNPEGLQD
ncbi:MAG: aspartate--tRNA ligase [Proteobacteria bacterium]|nr:aspartate--tRNA ligase [Pseudomonadota bacterium]